MAGKGKIYQNKQWGLCFQRPINGGLYPDFLLPSPFLRPVLASLRTYPVWAIDNFVKKFFSINAQGVRLGAGQGRKPTLTVDFLKQALAVGVLARAHCLRAAASTSVLCRRRHEIRGLRLCESTCEAGGPGGQLLLPVKSRVFALNLAVPVRADVWKRSRSRRGTSGAVRGC